MSDRSSQRKMWDHTSQTALWWSAAFVFVKDEEISTLDGDAAPGGTL